MTNHVLEEVSYLVFGYTASIATFSMTSVLAKGKTIEQALSLTEQDVEDALGGLPESKRHFSNRGISALKNAIQNYLERMNTHENCHSCR